MTASRTVDPRARGPSWAAASRRLDGPPPAVILRAAGGLAAAAAVGSGALLVVRRLAGAIEPAAGGLVIGVAGAGLALVCLADAARRRGAALAVPVAARIGLLLAVAALALPPRADVTGRIAAACAVAAAALAAVRLPRPVAAGRRHVSPADRRGDPPAGRRGSRADRREPQPGVVRQRFERRALDGGAERVRGRVVVAVPAGARTGYGHLGFCPAFPATPAVEVSTAYDGVEVTVTAAEVLPWGVRVECRLAEPAEEPLDIAVDLVAAAAPAEDGQPAADGTPAAGA